MGKLSRRDFLKGSGAAALTMAVAGLTGCAAQDTHTTPPPPAWGTSPPTKRSSTASPAAGGSPTPSPWTTCGRTSCPGASAWTSWNCPTWWPRR